MSHETKFTVLQRERETTVECHQRKTNSECHETCLETGEQHSQATEHESLGMRLHLISDPLLLAVQKSRILQAVQSGAGCNKGSISQRDDHKSYLAVECSDDIVSNCISVCIEQIIDIINHLPTMVADCKSGS